MLSQTLLSTLVVLAVSGGCMAKPITSRLASSKRTSSSPISFNNYQNIPTMSNFDNFNGLNNFDGSSNSIIVKQEDIRVCHSVQVEILQQQLTVIREYVKKLVTEQVCETEVQTVVIQQFSSGMDSFSQDVRRQSGRPVAYDQDVASKINQLMPDSNGNINSNNLGFNGSSVGSSAVQVQGSNWNNSTSYNTTQSAYNMAKMAANSTSS